MKRVVMRAKANREGFPLVESLLLLLFPHPALYDSVIDPAHSHRTAATRVRARYLHSSISS